MSAYRIILKLYIKIKNTILRKANEQTTPGYTTNASGHNEQWAPSYNPDDRPDIRMLWRPCGGRS